MYWFNLTLQAPKKIKNGDSSPNNIGAVPFLACGVETKFLVINLWKEKRYYLEIRRAYPETKTAQLTLTTFSYHVLN